MYARARWPLALRWVAAALVFESALSFRQRVYVVHQDKLGIGSSHRSSSSPLPSVSTLSSLHTRSSSTSTSITSATSSSSSASNRRRSSPRPDLALDHERRRRRIRINRVTPQTQPRGGSLSAAAAAEDAADVSEERGAAAAAAVAAHSSGAAVPPEPDEARQVSSSNPTEARTAAKRHYDGDFLMEQKLESAKAAILCGGVGAASRLLAVGVGAAVPPLLREALATPEPVASAVLFGLAAGFVQGALFGLTYRYVVRSDREAPTAQQATRTKAAPPQQMDGFTVGHLGDGCVAAFALTSALGQSEVPLSLAAGEFAGVFERGGGVVEALAAVLLPAAPFLPRAAAGLLFYSIARTAIDRALDQGAIKPFP